MLEKWILASPADLGLILISTAAVYISILAYTRLVGLRSFSKMSAADFAMTIATGSLFGATIVSPSPTLFMGMFAILCVFIGQWLLALARRVSPLISKIVDNQPLLLMRNGEMLPANLRRANMSESDVYGKLREANAYRSDQVLAVIFETTGDVSVIHDVGGGPELEARIFNGVVGFEA